VATVGDLVVVLALIDIGRGEHMRSPTGPKKIETSKNTGLTIPFRPYIRMDITHDDSLRLSAFGILGIVIALLIFLAQDIIISLPALIAGQISLRLHTTWDVAGYVASLLVIAAFCMKDIISLRAVAILSNLAFLTYGLALGLEPIWVLHGILLPLNCWRLNQVVVQRRRAGTA